MAECNRILQAAGVPYPRTCALCKLGPCQKFTMAVKPASGSVWLLWAQHYDKSGEKFIRVYGSEADAMAAKQIVEGGSPSMAIYVTEIPFMSPFSEEK